MFGAMSRPGTLEITVGMAAHPQGEPDAVLNGIEVECLTNPGLARRRATNRKNAREILSFLVGRDSRRPVITLHRHPGPVLQIAARASSLFGYLTRALLTVQIKSGEKGCS